MLNVLLDSYPCKFSLIRLSDFLPAITGSPTVFLEYSEGLFFSGFVLAPSEIAEQKFLQMMSEHAIKAVKSQ